MKILVLDNYDSFTYNLVHYVKELTGEPVDVYRNDEITLDEVDEYDKILLSPGPGVPDEAGIMKDLIARYGKTKSILEYASVVKLLRKCMAEVSKTSTKFTTVLQPT